MDRRQRMAVGVQALDRWMDDLVRGGLASLETAGSAPWSRQARRLVDAQAPGLARWVGSLAAVPGSGPDWPEVLLGELGRIALLTEAFHRFDDLPPPLQDDVLRRLGWSLRKVELLERGERVRDRWVVLGCVEEEDELLRTRRDWLAGLDTGRIALVLQFAHGSRRFDTKLDPGTMVEGELCFWPGANPQRALLVEGQSSGVTVGDLPGHEDIDGLLDRVSTELGRDPWAHRFGGALRQVVPVFWKDEWWLRDHHGRALAFRSDHPWSLLALSGGHPVDVAVEWDHRFLSPLAVVADGVYQVLR
ncbi:MAG: SWIM zinc finger family protein [Deltaproteobacteria bacterium]|nr:SWIM zinc finger family protein [Deltaproteobacteria bacterium]